MFLLTYRLQRNVFIKLLCLLGLFLTPVWAELPEMMIGVIPETESASLGIFNTLKGAIFVCLAALCFKGLRIYNKMAIFHTVWLLSTGYITLFAWNNNHSLTLDFSYFSFSLFLAIALNIYASAEYLKHNIFNNSLSPLYDNIVYGVVGVIIALISITGVKNPNIASDIILWIWGGSVIIGTLIGIYYIVDKSVQIDLVILGWIPAHIGLIIALSIGTNTDMVSVIASIAAWSCVIIAHSFLSILSFLKFQQVNNNTLLQTHNPYNPEGDSVGLIIDKAVFRINHTTQKIILNQTCAKMLHITETQSEFTIETFKALIEPEYQSVIDKILYEEITAPEIIKFHACNQAGFIQPLQLRGQTTTTEADILFLYQEITGIMPVTNTRTNAPELLNDYKTEFLDTPSVPQEGIHTDTENTQPIFQERRKISDMMYFINRAVSEIQKNSQITGDYCLLLLQIKHYDDWQVILGVSQTYQLVKKVTQSLEKSLSVFENLVIKNFNGDIIGIFCHLHSLETEVERLKLIIHKQFEIPIKVDNYNLFVNFLQGITKISVGDPQISLAQDNLVALVTNMIDSSKRLLNMSYDTPQIDIRKLALPQGSNIIQLSTDLRYAPEREQINAYYAPIISLQKGVTIGFDISPVWRHPDFGIIQGDILNYLGERCRMDNTINRLVIVKSIEGIVKLAKSNKMPIMNFTISRKLILGARIDEEIKNLCDVLKINPATLRLEFCADCLTDNPKWLGNILTDLKAIGVTTVLSGFGSAKGQLASLANLAFDRVIIDSEFADNIIHNERKFFALKSLVTMLNNMAIKADIKDVTSKEAFKLLFNAGISNVSGRVFGEPMPIERAVNILRKTQKVS